MSKEVIEIKMGWSNLVNAIIMLIENNQKQVAREELAKMAKAADLYNDIINRDVKKIIINELKGEREVSDRMTMTDQQIADMTQDIVDQIFGVIDSEGNKIED
jgi:hypothetical protein